MKKPRQVSRKARAIAAPAVEMTRDAAREVYEKITAAHERAAKPLREKGSR
jgi:hypothetical protein